MKRPRTFRLDERLIKKLSEETNQTDLIETLLWNYYSYNLDYKEIKSIIELVHCEGCKLCKRS